MQHDACWVAPNQSLFENHRELSGPSALDYGKGLGTHVPGPFSCSSQGDSSSPCVIENTAHDFLCVAVSQPFVAQCPGVVDVSKIAHLHQGLHACRIVAQDPEGLASRVGTSAECRQQRSRKSS